VTANQSVRSGRQAVLGAGGIGGLVAAALAHQGADVTVILRPEALAAYPASLSVTSPQGSWRVSVQRAAAVAQAYDVLWVAVKATHLEDALGAVRDDQEIGAIVPLLNGIDHVATLRHRFGHDRVVPATIAVESERISPGVIIQRSPFARLSMSARGESRLAPALETLRQFGFTCQFVSDEVTLLWSKCVFLAPLALATTAARLSIGEVLADAEWRGRLDACVAEACRVALEHGATVDAAQVMAALRGLPPAMRSSMQKDVAAGRAPELDAIAGPVLRGAAAYAIDAPVTGELAAIVREMDQAKSGRVTRSRVE
jgi:2-dehydropantoate 2-reductase